jgi:hypothetical protein
MPTNQKIIIAIVVAVVALFLYKYFYAQPQQENFLSAGQMQNLGTIIPDGVVGDYEMVQNGNVRDSLDTALSSTDFAEMVNGDQMVEAVNPNYPPRPFERLQNLSDSYFPTVASKALPFSQAAAKPLYHQHAVNLPRVNLKGKLYEMNLSEAVRGSVPINYDPNVSMVASSQYRNEDSFNPGFMTPAFNSLHNKLTGSHKNLPMYISGAGSADSGGGIGGMSVEAIYDA